MIVRVDLQLTISKEDDGAVDILALAYDTVKEIERELDSGMSVRVTEVRVA